MSSSSSEGYLNGQRLQHPNVNNQNSCWVMTHPGYDYNASFRAEDNFYPYQHIGPPRMAPSPVMMGQRPNPVLFPPNSGSNVALTMTNSHRDVQLFSWPPYCYQCCGPNDQNQSQFCPLTYIPSSDGHVGLISHPATTAQQQQQQISATTPTATQHYESRNVSISTNVCCCPGNSVIPETKRISNISSSPASASLDKSNDKDMCATQKHGIDAFDDQNATRNEGTCSVSSSTTNTKPRKENCIDRIQTRTPLYGGLPSWWGDGEDDVTTATHGRSLPKVPVKTDNVHEVRENLCVKAAIAKSTPADVINAKSKSNESEDYSKYRTEHPCSVMSSGYNGAVVVSSPASRPAVSFTVSLDGNPLEFNANLSHYLPVNKQRHLSQRRVGTANLPTTLHKQISQIDDDVISEAGTYIVCPGTPSSVRSSSLTSTAVDDFELLKSSELLTADTPSEPDDVGATSSLDETTGSCQDDQDITIRSQPSIACTETSDLILVADDPVVISDVDEFFLLTPSDFNQALHQLPFTDQNSLVPTFCTSSTLASSLMSNSHSNGGRPHHGTAGGGSVTWRSIDTNVLLQNVDELETARTVGSVDTNVLLQNLDELETARTVGSVDTDLLLADNLTFAPSQRVNAIQTSVSVNHSSSLQPSNSLLPGQFVPPLSRKITHDSFDLMTARSVSSVDCAPAVYDTDRRHVDDVKSLRASTLSHNDFMYSADFEADETATARSDSSLDAALRLRDSPVSEMSADDGRTDDRSASPSHSVRTSRTLASVDTNILLKTTEDVVMAMEIARGRHQHAKLHYNEIELRQSQSEADVRLTSDTRAQDNCDSERSNEGIWNDVDSSVSSERREQTAIIANGENVLVGSSKSNPSGKKPPAHSRKLTNTSTTAAAPSWTPTKHAVGNVWRSLSDLDVRHQRTSVAKSKSSLSRVNETGFASSTDCDTDRSSDFSAIGRSSAVHFNDIARRHGTGGQPRSRSSSRTKSSEQGDSSRSVTSAASLGQKIVARSRENMKPTIKSRQHSSTTGKQVTFQRPPADKPSSGLVLEGYRVPVRPASTTFNGHAVRTTNSSVHGSVYSNSAARTTWHDEAQVAANATSNLDRRLTDVSLADGREHYSEFDGTLGLNGDKSLEIVSVRDEQCVVNAALVSSVSQMSSTVVSQADQLVSLLKRTLKLQVDGYGKASNQSRNRDVRSGNSAELDLLNVLDNLESAGHQLLAVNKALATLAATKHRNNHLT